MTLADLLTELSTRGAMKTSRVPAMKTSLKYLAEALGHSSRMRARMTSPCARKRRGPGNPWKPTRHADDAEQNHQRVYQAQRRNDIRKVFKLAETHGLLTALLPPRLLAKSRTRVFLRQQSATAPYQTTYRSQIGPHRFTLPQDAWPPDIQAGWRDYRARCSLRLREATLKNSRRCWPPISATSRTSVARPPPGRTALM